MRMSEIAIRRPVFTGMVALAVLVLGGLAFSRLGLGLFPNISIPIVAVVVPYPGASPEEVESQVTRPIEDILYGINDVDQVISYSRDSVAQIIVTFKMSADPQQASNDVRDRMAMVRSTLPRDIMDPIISRFDPNSSPVLTYMVSGVGTSAQTRRMVEDVLVPALQRVEGVGNVMVTGGDQREIRVEVDRAKLDATPISMAQFAQLLGAEAIDVPGGRVTSGDGEISVKAVGRFQSPEDIGEVVLMGLPNGAQLRVKDVATVVDGVKEVRTISRVDGRTGVSFVVFKQATANTVDVVRKVEKELESVSGQIPRDVKVQKIIDNSTFTEATYVELRMALILGAVFAIFVIFLFMLDWRSTVISAIALPISVIGTFFVIWQLGFSLNLISMISLSLAIGMLIDDSVVVRENIFRHLERGEDPFTAARTGTAEIALAVVATTLTIVAVFVPIAFTGGLVGRFLKEFGITVAAAVLVSMVVSLTVDPMLSARLVQNIPPDYHEQRRRHRVFGIFLRSYDALDGLYRRMLVWALGHRKTVVFSAIGIFLASLGLVQLMGTQFIPRGDQSAFTVILEMPAGTALAETDRVTKQVEDMIGAVPEVVTVSTTVGPDEMVNKSVISVLTTPREKRDRSVTDIMEVLRPRLAAIPGLVYRLDDADIFGQSFAVMAAPFTLQVRGSDYDELGRIAGEAFAMVQATDGVRDAAISLRPGMPEHSLFVDRTRSGDMGVIFAQAAMTLRMGLTGAPVAKFRDGSKDIDVRVQLRPEDRAGVDSVLGLKVPTNRDGMVALRDVVNVKQSVLPATIERQNRERYITITANLAGRSLGSVIKDIQPRLDSIDKPDGYRLEFAGDAEMMDETFRNMALALILGVLFIYFVLASQFESLIHPLTIMLSLPLALVGALVTLFLFGKSLDVIALIGVVLLMGLVTKNAILLVDYTNQLRDRGKGIIEALLEAGPTRLRPILMTSAAMVLGMLPTAISTGAGAEFRVPMSISVIGGIISSTFLTLLVVPVVYVWLDRFTMKGRRERRNQV